MLLDKFPTFLHGHDYLPCSPQCCRVSLLPFFMDMTPSPTLSSMMLGKSPTFLHGHDSLAHALHNAGPFVAQHHRKRSLWVVAIQRVGISMAHTSGHNLEASFRAYNKKLWKVLQKQNICNTAKKPDKQLTLISNHQDHSTWNHSLCISSEWTLSRDHPL